MDLGLRLRHYKFGVSSLFSLTIELLTYLYVALMKSLVIATILN